MRIIIAFGFIALSLILLKAKPEMKWPVSAGFIAAVVYFAFLTREPTPVYHYSIRLFGAAKKALELGGGIISAVLKGDSVATNWISLEGIILNILLFVPVGYLVPLVLPWANCWWKVMLFGVALSLSIEMVQLITRLGYADVDDLMNNTIGTLVGYALYKKLLSSLQL